MKTLCWNVKGLGSLRGVQMLQDMLRQYNPQLVFLMETKVSGNKMEQIKRSCGFKNGIEVGAEGSRGQLCMAWKDGVDVVLQSYTKSHIDVVIMSDIEDEWRYTDFYSSLAITARVKAWQLLRQLR